MLLSVVVLLLPISAVTSTALRCTLSILFCRGGTRNEPYALASRKELKSRTRALWNLVAAVVVADDFADASADASAAVVAARAMHKHAHAHIHAGRQAGRAALCDVLSLRLPLPVSLPLRRAAPPSLFACDPSTCDRLGCIYLLLDNNSSFGRQAASVAVAAAAAAANEWAWLSMCVCVCVGLISA